MVVRGNTVMQVDAEAEDDVRPQTAVASLRQTVTSAFARNEPVAAATLGARSATIVGQPTRSKGDLRIEAKIKGYEGESCGECHNFTLLRNGTCMKCDTCGSTSGCS